MTTNTPAPAIQEALLTDDEIRDVITDAHQAYGAFRTGYRLALGRAIESALLSKLRAPVADERAALQKLVDLEDMRLRLRALHESGHGTDYDHYHKALPDAWNDARAALASAPVAGEAQPVAYQVRHPHSPEWWGCDKAAFDVVRATRPKDARALYAAPQANAPSIRIGRATTKGGRVQSYAFEQTDLPDGEHALTVGAPQASEAVRQEDVATVLNFIFERFGAPCTAGDLPGYVVAAVRRLEHAALSAQPSGNPGELSAQPGAQKKEPSQWQALASALAQIGGDIPTKHAGVWLELSGRVRFDPHGVAVSNLVLVAQEKASRVGTNAGHGHVWARPDGLLAKCGGPAICAECARDQAQAHPDNKDGGENG